MDSEPSENLLDLLQQHGHSLMALLFRLTLCHEASADLLQDLFLRLQKSKGFQDARDPRRYLFRAAINLAMDWRRKNQRRDVVEPLQQEPVTWDSPSQQVVQREQMELVLEALQQLPDEKRELIVLRFIHGWSYEQLARHFGSSEHRMRGLCSKSMTRLRKLLKVGVAEDR